MPKVVPQHPLAYGQVGLVVHMCLVELCMSFTMAETYLEPAKSSMLKVCQSIAVFFQWVPLHEKTLRFEFGHKRTTRARVVAV